VSVERAHDPERVEACSAALRQKYAKRPGLRGMLTDAVLPTTLELRPPKRHDPERPDPVPVEMEGYYSA
jgi:hypothetical protein